MGDATAAWVADAESAFCMQCSAEFWLLLRRHHCRNCGQLLCYQCSPWRTELAQVVSQAGSTPGVPGTTYRVCKACAGVGNDGGNSSSPTSNASYGPRVPAKKGLPNALHVAASVGNVCKLLDGIEPLVAAAKGAGGAVPWEVDAGDKSRHTPLHLAVMGGHVDCAKALLEAGCNPNLLTEKGVSGWDLCVVVHSDAAKTRGRQAILKMRGSVHRLVAPDIKFTATGTTRAPAISARTSEKSTPSRNPEKSSPPKKDKKKSKSKEKTKANAEQKEKKKPQQKLKRSSPKQKGGGGVRASKKVGDDSGTESSDLEEWSD